MLSGEAAETCPSVSTGLCWLRAGLQLFRSPGLRQTTAATLGCSVLGEVSAAVEHEQLFGSVQSVESRHAAAIMISIARRVLYGERWFSAPLRSFLLPHVLIPDLCPTEHPVASLFPHITVRDRWLLKLSCGGSLNWNLYSLIRYVCCAATAKRRGKYYSLPTFCFCTLDYIVCVYFYTDIKHTL